MIPGLYKQKQTHNSLKVRNLAKFHQNRGTNSTLSTLQQYTLDSKKINQAFQIK